MIWILRNLDASFVLHTYITVENRHALENDLRGWVASVMCIKSKYFQSCWSGGI